ncbi:MAG: type II toxin-antitoxin system VapC family toxin, partial [bacterium]|nr:type II toxin-antitoxin system VapC family toxin [bacterium]
MKVYLDNCCFNRPFDDQTQLPTETIDLTPEITRRAKEFETSGLQAFDAMHLACAETQADVLLTVDDK